MKKYIILCLLSTLTIIAFSNLTNAQSSRNGYKITVHGEIRILVVYVQIAYTQNPQLDKTDSTHHAIWPVNGLPNWKDNMYDTGLFAIPYGEIIIKV